MSCPLVPTPDLVAGRGQLRERARESLFEVFHLAGEGRGGGGERKMRMRDQRGNCQLATFSSTHANLGQLLVCVGDGRQSRQQLVVDIADVEEVKTPVASSVSRR